MRFSKKWQNLNWNTVNKGTKGDHAFLLVRLFLGTLASKGWQWEGQKVEGSSEGIPPTPTLHPPLSHLSKSLPLQLFLPILPLPFPSPIL